MKYYILFAEAAIETLPGVAAGWERGGGGLEVYINLMPPGVTKITSFPYFGPSGRHPLEGTRALPIQFAINCNEKRDL